MGNICRSPMAEGAFRAAASEAGLIDRIRIDSAGTIGYHAGSAPDDRAIDAARKHGVDISGQRSRIVTDSDFTTYNYIMVMDRENLQDLMARSPDQFKDRLQLFLSFAPQLQIDEMPDPYYGPSDQFSVCFRAAKEAAEGLLSQIKEKHF